MELSAISAIVLLVVYSNYMVAPLLPAFSREFVIGKDHLRIASQTARCILCGLGFCDLKIIVAGVKRYQASDLFIRSRECTLLPFSDTPCLLKCLPPCDVSPGKSASE